MERFYFLLNSVILTSKLMKKVKRIRKKVRFVCLVDSCPKNLIISICSVTNKDIIVLVLNVFQNLAFSLSLSLSLSLYRLVYSFYDFTNRTNRTKISKNSLKYVPPKILKNVSYPKILTPQDVYVNYN